MILKAIRGFWVSSLFVTFVVLITITLSGCNLFSSFDQPEDSDELREAALVDLDAGKCIDAANRFSGMTNLSDEAYHIIGWAQMCAAGASITNVAKNLFSYSSGSTNSLLLVGKLSNTLTPSDDTKVAAFATAVTTFNKITETKTRAVDVTLANLVKAAAVVAKSASLSGDTSAVTRADISTSCSSDCTTCTAGMTNADATTLRSTILSASQTASSVTGLGSVSDLASALNTQLGSTDQATRCAVYYQFFEN